MTYFPSTPPWKPSIDDELETLLGNSTQSDVDREIERLTHRALTSIAPPLAMPGGELYAGWPLSDLLKLVPDPILRDKVENEIRRRAMQNAPPPLRRPEPKSRPFTLNERMAARMHWGTFDGRHNVWAPGFEHMTIHQAGDKVFIFVITKDIETVTLEDEAGLFPSDATITKLRLLEKT